MAYTKTEYFVGKRGWMRTVRHDFSQFGDVMEKYWHKGPDTEHTIYMMMGRIRIVAADDQPFDLKAGDRCDWPANAEYSVTALQAPSRFYAHFGPNSGLMQTLHETPEEQATKYGT